MGRCMSCHGLPCFILLGLIIGESRVGRGFLFGRVYKWVGRLPGFLAIASLVAIALF